MNPTHTPFVTDHKAKAVGRQDGNAIKEETMEYTSISKRLEVLDSESNVSPEGAAFVPRTSLHRTAGTERNMIRKK